MPIVLAGVKILSYTLSLLLYAFSSNAQNEILVVGNSNEICFDTNLNVVYEDNLDHIFDYRVLLIFSGASSTLKNDDISKIMMFIKNGGGLYLGCDNWPFQAESDVILDSFFSFHSWGNFDSEIAHVSEVSEITQLKEITSGISVAVFPVNSNFKVDVWIEDQPLIMSGDFDNGRLILDGGYSRFYCENMNGSSNLLLIDLINYLFRRQH